MSFIRVLAASCAVGLLAVACASAPLPFTGDPTVAVETALLARTVTPVPTLELALSAAPPPTRALPEATVTPIATVESVAAILPDLGPAPELRGIVAWINSEPATLAELRGKVVLVNFWTYGCYNCRNTLPYVTRWYNTYHDQGFVVLGIHTPEFAREYEIANVRAAVEREGIHYPVAQDNDYATWRAWRNRYWPAAYFVDVKGRIRHVQIGEGGYDRSEAVIRELLAEAAAN